MRALLLVLDSVGCGRAPDAAAYGDAGADTLGHIFAAQPDLALPALFSLGLGQVIGAKDAPEPIASHGRMRERSPGKDTSTGHWELMGCPLEQAFPVFSPGFPPAIIDAFVRATGVPGILGNCAASGTEIIERLGVEHIQSGKPIVYTSADSVFQIAAHEQHFGLERLYRCCETARRILDPYGVGRVIARPFIGEPGRFQRTYNRRDYSMPPPRDTSLVRLSQAGIPVVGVGKIEDIFAGAGLSESIHTEGNEDGMRAVIALAERLERGLVFVNLVDFDMLYGHRRDARGYREALERFDVRLRELETRLGPQDLVLMTADHGNDPTKFETTDHTREHVPVLAAGAGVRAGAELGTRESFADFGATVEEALGLVSPGPGRSFLAELRA